MRQLRITAILLASVCLGSEINTHAAGNDRPHLDSLASVARDTKASSRIIVRYKDGAGARMQDRLRAKRADVRSTQQAINSLTLVASGQTLRDLASDPDVLGISTDAVIQAHGLSNWLLPAFDAQQLRRTLGLGGFPAGGRGVGIAVIDSGIAPVPDLAGRITAFYDFTAGGIATWPADAYGHGTHVAGLIAGSGVASAGAYVGIAPEARLVGLKVLDANGTGYTSDVIAAIDFAIEQRTMLGIDIINLSLGHPILEPASTDPLVQAVERATAAGIVVVTSAGNFGESRDTHQPGFGGISSPGNAPSALTVGALRTKGTVDRDDDSVASFSSRGPTWFDGAIKPDVLAPGDALIATSNPSSTLAKHARVTSGYLSLSGTSMASAVATGVVALMIEANRIDEGSVRLTPNTVKFLLQYSALPVAEPSPAVELIEGAGGINAAGAIELARVINPATAVGAHWLEYGVTAATRIGGTLHSWTRRVTWGDRLVAGEPLNVREFAWLKRSMWGTTVAWSQGVWLTASSVIDHFDLWSSQIVTKNKVVKAQDDDHIVWGNVDDDHIVWGNCSSAEDDHIVWGNCSDDDHVVWGNTLAKGPDTK